MMQEVNLLAGELKPQREQLPLAQLAALWGAFVVVLVLVSVWEGFSGWQLASDHSEREAQWRTLTETNADLRAAVRTVPQAALVAEVEALRERFATRALLMNAVQGYEQSSAGGFSRYLRDLAEQHVEGVALSHIELHDGGSHILLSGETATPVDVPRFLKRLSQGESFRGHRFDEFRLRAQESGLLRFDITGPARDRQG